MPPITGQNVLVIGGSAGIGLAVAKIASAEGANVSIASSNLSRVQSAVLQIREAVPGARVMGYVCDVNHDDAESSLEKLFADVNAAAGGQLLDHIVFTSGVLEIYPLNEMSMRTLRDCTQFKFVVPLLIGKLAPRYLKPSYKSSLTFTTGVLAEKPFKGTVVVSSVSSAMSGITKGLAVELAPIRVNAVSPGATDTDMLRAIPSMEERIPAILERALLGKVGTAEEVAEAYIYLMKDSNSTGSCVKSNGGGLLI
ncbi:uncharacterized protein GGS25DRAFT_488609 [Hypoxylon fragiforme]|uniref:uncharacterized protein n=1 Tax=Hypoxylon fragiforme TaxID=63214 RepID=UPI0020C69F2A|nr:uncharacterized protein GGS25DRAFT_488609 [Hypoxylon fragiforme]KAI2610383.1 hypothetical protein GGS25DRAFT_488609 [Hypoxylon fragiforme]